MFKYSIIPYRSTKNPKRYFRKTVHSHIPDQKHLNRLTTPELYINSVYTTTRILRTDPYYFSGTPSWVGRFQHTGDPMDFFRYIQTSLFWYSTQLTRFLTHNLAKEFLPLTTTYTYSLLLKGKFHSLGNSRTRNLTYGEGSQIRSCATSRLWLHRYSLVGRSGASNLTIKFRKLKCDLTFSEVLYTIWFLDPAEVRCDHSLSG